MCCLRWRDGHDDPESRAGGRRLRRRGQDGCPEILALTRPDAIGDIHRAYLAAGADVVETDTFTGTRLKLDDYALGARTHEINMAAAQLARAAADEFSTAERPRFVAGSMGPTGMLPSSDDPALSNITYQQLAELYREQAVGADRGRRRSAADRDQPGYPRGARRHHGHPPRLGRDWAAACRFRRRSRSIRSGRMLLGTDIGGASTILYHLGVDIVGLNCSTGPEHMREPVRYLTENIPLPISTIPNAGLPLNVDGQAVYPMEPEPMARRRSPSSSAHSASTSSAAAAAPRRSTSPASSPIWTTLDPAHRGHPQRRLTDFPDETRHRTDLLVASAMRATSLQQDPAPLLVGERVNSQGSRKVKQALLADDYDTLLQVARAQVEGGAHVLDVCVALTERADEAEQMRSSVKKLEMGVEAPLVIDSTEAGVMQAALETYPGRAIINSINLENGRQRVDAVLPLAREHGSAVVALTIDEEGMAKTAERKVAIAKRIFEIATDRVSGCPPRRCSSTR